MATTSLPLVSALLLTFIAAAAAASSRTRPNITAHPNNTCGYNVTFTCHAKGIPFPLNITWLKNGEAITYVQFDPTGAELLPMTRNMNGTDNETTISILYVLRVTAGEEGNYSCFAKNSFGNDMSMPAELKAKCQASVTSTVEASSSSSSTVISTPVTSTPAPSTAASSVTSTVEASSSSSSTVISTPVTSTPAPSTAASSVTSIVVASSSTPSTVSSTPVTSTPAPSTAASSVTSTVEASSSSSSAVSSTPVTSTPAPSTAASSSTPVAATTTVAAATTTSAAAATTTTGAAATTTAAAAATTTAAANTAATATASASSAATTNTASAAATSTPTAGASATTAGAAATTAGAAATTAGAAATTTATSAGTANTAQATATAGATTASKTSASTAAPPTPTSAPATTAAPPAKIKIAAAVKFTSINYTQELSDKNSQKYKDTVNKVKPALRDAACKGIKGSCEININGFSKGSLIVNFTMVFENIKGVDFSKNLTEIIKSGKIGNLTVDAQYIKITVKVEGVTFVWTLDKDSYLDKCCKSSIGQAKIKNVCKPGAASCDGIVEEWKELDCGDIAKQYSPPPCKACVMTSISTTVLLLGLIASKIIF